MRPAKTAKCDAETFHFIVADQLSGADSECENDNYSELTRKDNAKITKREDSVDPQCDENSGSVTFDKPKPLGYCIEVRSSQ